MQRDDFGAGVVAGARVALERRRPEIAQVAARIVDRKSLVERVDDPVGLQDLDPPLVGVDAVLGDQRRPAGLDRGARGEQAGIAGRNRVIDPRRRQRNDSVATSPPNSARQAQKKCRNDSCGMARS